LSSAKGKKIGWIGAGRMGFEMAKRLAKGGCDISVWNRTRAKAEPLAKDGAKIVDGLQELASCDIVFCMVSTYNDVKEVIAGPKGLLSGSGKPRMVVECSSISLDGSADLRKILAAKGVELLSAPVSGNAKVIKAGKLTFVVSGPKAAYDAAAPYLAMMGQGSSYVGEGELSRIVKICHNVMLGVVTQCLAEITVLAEKGGVPRSAFLEFLNNSVMGSTFTRYKSPAFVHLDYTPTFTPLLLRKDFDLGFAAAHDLDVPMPVAAAAAAAVQAAVSTGRVDEDFAILLDLQARSSGLGLKPEFTEVDDGLSSGGVP
jgi:3-hydroxyisobutyrate dehydrogenase-like beta-hydroxyacid dehydrogenase